MSVTQVLIRSLFAGGILLALTFPAGFALYLWVLNQQQNPEPVAGFPELVEFVPPTMGEMVLNALGDAFTSALSRLPHIALAALGSWEWQRRSINGQA